MSETAITPINIPYTEMLDRHLRVSVGACRLTIVPGGADVWVAGTYRDPSGRMPLRITQEGSTVRIEHLRDVTGLIGLFTGVPELALSLGTRQPFRLTLEAGASQNSLDLGGIPLTRLVVKQGAGASTIDFSAPNPVVMNLLQVGVGAAGVDARRLANANANTMTLEAGATGYTFDFGGALQRDTYVKISTGVSSVEISVPATTAARIASESVLSHLGIGDGFTRKDGAFCTPAALEGKTPLLTIEAAVALGLLELRLTTDTPSAVPAPMGTSTP